MPSPHAIILFAHGSRDPLWRAPLEAVASTIAAQHPQLPVRCAYLELCAPDLPTVAIEIIAACAMNTGTIDVNGTLNTPLNIRIVPMFLGMGKHAREDLPELVVALRHAYPEVNFEVVAPIGEDPRVTALLADMAVG